MPPSKQVRARQNRQRARIAVAHAERRETQRRRRILLTIAGGMVVIAAVVVAVIFRPSSHSKSTSSSATTATTAATAGHGNCVAAKGPLPKGAPAVPVPVGAPPKTLVTKDLKVGTGAVVPKSATVEVNYIGVACSTGKIFDSSYSRNQAFSANLGGGVIPGWQQGIPGMRLGGTRLLGIPPNLAYGASGQPPDIGPNETLWFVVQPTKLG